MAREVCRFCEAQERREDAAQSTVCFDLNEDLICEVLEGAFDLSIETYEGRPIVGGFLLARDAASLVPQVPTWRMATLDMDVSRLSFEEIKHVAGVLTRDTWAVVCPGRQGRLNVAGIMRQRRIPLYEAQSGALCAPAFTSPPLAVSIEGPGVITVGVNHAVIAARRGGAALTRQMRNPLVFLALWRSTGHWGDPSQSAALFDSVRRQLELDRLGGTIVIGPRVGLDDLQMVQPGAIEVTGINVAGAVMGDFASNLIDLDRFKAEPLREYLRLERERQSTLELRDLLVALSRVDGAVLIDETGEVYAYHVYFSAGSHEPTHKGEGSRHRTLRAFVTQNRSMLALVVSQDGITTELLWDHDTSRVVERRSRHGMLLEEELSGRGF